MDYGVSAPPARHVIVHFHMFKNGGSTIETILEREFRGHFATIHGPHANSVLDGQDIAAFIGTHVNVAALSSHHLRYPLPSIRRTVLFDCCFLRHPLDRLHSVYTYLRADSSKLRRDNPVQELAKSTGPREFMMRLMDESPHLASNAQTLLIANGGVFTRPMDHTDLARAMETLRRMAMPGLVETFDESLVAAEHFLSPAFPAMRLHYIAQNVTRPSRKLDQHLEELRTIWGSDLYEEVLRLNRLDLQLCDYAKDQIHRRFSLVPNHREKLAEFKARCSGLHLQVA